MLATAGCCAAITVLECSDWLQHCPINIHAKIILFHFRRGSMLKENSLIATQQLAVAGRQLGNFRAPAGACATNSAHGRGSAKIIL